VPATAGVMVYPGGLPIRYVLDSRLVCRAQAEDRGHRLEEEDMKDEWVSERKITDASVTDDARGGGWHV
jgi:hypothetical protein